MTEEKLTLEEREILCSLKGATWDLKASTICKLLKTKGYNIEEVLNWFQLLESGKEENYLLCLTIINSKIKL